MCISLFTSLKMTSVISRIKSLGYIYINEHEADGWTENIAAVEEVLFSGEFP
mgnify:FL=1